MIRSVLFIILKCDRKCKWAAFDWMFRNQLGRRNLTDEQRTYILGKLYEARKHIHGGNRGNQYTKVGNGQNVAVAKTRDGVSKIIATELSVAPKVGTTESELYMKSPQNRMSKSIPLTGLDRKPQKRACDGLRGSDEQIPIHSGGGAGRGHFERMTIT